ncbi:tetratricopeptide repeat protein [Limnobacter parvus]|uniref:Tetratricopeptide repeat protein n=1 Tax=Limnobacter parvus TaxID=2939690 RepID=A0ABT1XKE8_9BURK|nr:hypothetical protein [Limnobacter parvus]MCR2746569.1 hypothetical protein [Limnobacter parvus]
MNSSILLEHSPEWRAFLDRRQEIENDPTLDEKSKQTLIENWQMMAQESKPHMFKVESSRGAPRAWATPTALPVLIALTLTLATLLTYTIGAMNPGATKWPSMDSAAVNAPTVDQAVLATEGHPGDGASLEDRLAGLKARLAQQPDDLQGWVLMARTHASMANYSESAQALQAALALTPGHPDILADLADMTAMAQGRKLAGEPEQYIAAALQSDPRHEKALALAASAAEQAGDNDKAQVYWQLLSQVQQADLQSNAPAQVLNVLTIATVTISKAALNTMNEDSALFVFLKSESGPGMPLAVVRVPATALIAGSQPVRFGPGDFIQEGAIDNLPETLYFQARLSIQGMAQTSTGDIDSAWVAVPRNQLESGVNLNLSEGQSK